MLSNLKIKFESDDGGDGDVMEIFTITSISMINNK